MSEQEIYLLLTDTGSILTRTIKLFTRKNTITYPWRLMQCWRIPSVSAGKKPIILL